MSVVSCELTVVDSTVNRQLSTVNRQPSWAIALPEIDHLAGILSPYDSPGEFNLWNKSGRKIVKISEDLFSVLILFDQWKQNTGGVANQKSYLKIMDIYAPLLVKLTPETGEKLLRSNYERLFDTANKNKGL